MYAVLPPTSELQAVTVSHRQQYNSIRYEDMISAILITIVIVIIILTVIYEEKNYKWDKCGFVAVHFGEKTHKCNQCFVSSNLGIHIKRHSREDLNDCDQCDIKAVRVRTKSITPSSVFQIKVYHYHITRLDVLLLKCCFFKEL